ncbi:hypothetical protein CEXT_735482 [Caerostris extrusa]|uniref:Uncharacterized protein n=1 Tax=Caerostris extrusa TaxID=172846 RepID=A0AAV4T1B1_CAEEX|nr:hypothetical protein CEXT_735482 [Caerostris extrusa]
MLVEHRVMCAASFREGRNSTGGVRCFHFWSLETETMWVIGRMNKEKEDCSQLLLQPWFQCSQDLRPTGNQPKGVR